MHVSVFEYEVTGIDEAGWAAACDQVAPAFADVPGLIAKVWLTGADGRYGGVYLWRDEEAYRAFLDGELCAMMADHPNITGVVKRDWAVQEAPTAVTRGLLQPA